MTGRSLALTLNLGLRYEIRNRSTMYKPGHLHHRHDQAQPRGGNICPAYWCSPRIGTSRRDQKSFMDTSWRELDRASAWLSSGPGPRSAHSLRHLLQRRLRTGNGFRGSTAGYSVNSTAARPIRGNTSTTSTRHKGGLPVPPFVDPSFGVDTSSSFQRITRDLGKSGYIQTWNFGLQRKLRATW